MLDQRQDVVQILYKCFVFAGLLYFAEQYCRQHKSFQDYFPEPTTDPFVAVPLKSYITSV